MTEKMIVEQPSRSSGLLTVEEAAAYLRVKPNTVYQWASMGILAKVKLGGKLLFRQCDLDEFIQRGWKPGRNGYQLPGEPKGPIRKPTATHAKPIKVKVKRPGPTATHAYPRGPRKPRIKREETRFFRTQPSARRHLLRIWGIGRKG